MFMRKMENFMKVQNQYYNAKINLGFCKRASDVSCIVCKFLIVTRKIDRIFLATEPLLKM